MKYKVTKKFYDPFLMRRVEIGEIVSIEDENLDGYKKYIEIPEVIETAKVEPIIEVAAYKPKPKPKVGGKQ